MIWVTIVRSRRGVLVAGDDWACFVDWVKYALSDRQGKINGGGTWRYEMSLGNVQRARKMER